MGIQLIFWLLVSTTVVLMLAIFLVSFLFLKVLRNGHFVPNSLNTRSNEDSQSEGTSHKGLTLSLIGILVSTSLFAQPVKTPSFFEGVNLTVLWVLLFVDVILLVVFLYLVWVLRRVIAGPEADSEKSTFVSRISQTLTDSVPLEREEEIIMDHEYDGIHELDNSLPPWWKWLFYITVFSGVVYMMRYHIFKSGDLQYEAYEKEIVEAKEEIKAYLKSQAMNIDETNVTLLTDAGAIASGKALFDQYCQVCHGKNGEGLVGPNLTDQYWIYGNKIKNIFETIKYGRKNGMKSWKDELNPLQMQQLGSFIKSIQGTNPDNPKPPQGTKMVD